MSYQPHEVGELLVSSKNVAQTFRVKVLQPVRRTDGSERFPVIYATDGDEFFDGLAVLATMLQDHGETPRFVLVGIGYEHGRAVLRSRDLFTHSIRSHFFREIEEGASLDFVAETEDIRTITQTTDASAFLCFIRDELMPLINDQFPTQPSDASFSGYSAGGTFGLYTLFTQPDTFKRYILGSPATSYNGCHFGIDLAKAFFESGRSVDARVFMSVGELEEFKRGTGQFDLVSGYYLLAKFLNQARIPGLDLTCRLFPQETHATAWAMAFTHGLRTLFDAVEEPLPYWPAYLKE